MTDKLTCPLCIHRCRLAPGQHGLCGVIANQEGQIVCLAYGHPSTLHIDPIEKKPLYHLLPGSRSFSLGTVGCNFRCPFCQNWQISQAHDIPQGEPITPKVLVEAARREECASISYTYNEPTVFYPYAHDIGRLAKENGLKNIFVTNGFQTPELIDEMATWVDAVNIDLKSFDDAYYAKILKGALEGVKANIARCREQDIWVEVTTLIIPGINDDETQIEAIARFLASVDTQMPWHLLAFHPDYKMLNTPPTSAAILQRAREIGHAVGLKHIYLGNVSLLQTTACASCGTPLIQRNGYRITRNALQHGCCLICGAPLAGVWD